MRIEEDNTPSLSLRGVIYLYEEEKETFTIVCLIRKVKYILSYLQISNLGENPHRLEQKWHVKFQEAYFQFRQPSH
jgi:hypothetical protein